MVNFRKDYSFYLPPSLPPSKGKEKFLATLHRYMEIHGTVYYEAQRPPEVPAFVKNHGLLPQQELQELLRKAKVRGTLQRSSSLYQISGQKKRDHFSFNL